ncbi:MAG: GNAT family N-acetyltransferase [Pseudomonadota bacterium]
MAGSVLNWLWQPSRRAAAPSSRATAAEPVLCCPAPSHGDATIIEAVLDDGSSVTLRDAVPSDEAALLELQRQLCAWEADLHPNRSAAPDKVADTLRRVSRWAVANQGRILVAQSEETVVGVIICGLGDDIPPYLADFDHQHGYIADICVADTSRGRGIGQLLVAAAETHLRASGVNQIQVGCLAANTRAWALYEALGYRPYEVALEKRLDSRSSPSS